MGHSHKKYASTLHVCLRIIYNLYSVFVTSIGLTRASRQKLHLRAHWIVLHGRVYTSPCLFENG